MNELCIQQFITHVRDSAQQGRFAKDLPKHIMAEMKMLKQNGLTKLHTRFGDIPHPLVVNTFSLFAIAAFEYLRAHGLHASGTENILSPLLGASISGTGGDGGGDPDPNAPIVPREIIEHNEKWGGEVWKDPNNPYG